MNNIELYLTSKQISTIYQLSKKLNTIEFEEYLIEEALDLVIKALNAERGLFVKHNVDDNSFSIIAARNILKENIDSLEEFSSGVLKEVLKNNKPILFHDVQQEPIVANFESVRIKGIKSIIGVPVVYGETLWGIVIADSLKHREKFTEQNLHLLDLFSNLLSLALDRIIKVEELKKKNMELQNQIESIIEIPELIGKSKVIKKMISYIDRVAKTNATVLITGESGTGKDLVAQAIHTLSARKENTYLAQFCGSIPDNLLESEMFGYKKGAFTGAVNDKKGLLEATDKGTFFLDEIGDISPALQAKLLRVIENQEIMRIGETVTRKIDVRIITATNKNLQELVRKNEFRQDLLYRLNVYPISVPPLRERKGDISLLTLHFLKKLGGLEFEIDKSALKKLEQYNWPGNVRELINVIQRAVINAESNKIKSGDIEFDTENLNFYEGTLENIEKMILKKRLEEFNGNKTLTANSLGVSRKWIYLKLEDMKNK